MMRRRRLLGVLVFFCHASTSLGFALTRYTQTAISTTTTTRRQQQEQRREFGSSQHGPAARHWSRSSRAIRSSSSSASNNRQDADDDHSALFPRASSYVPSGLSPEEYRRIKTSEASKFAGLNLGAWGPKFLRSSGGGPPPGDWMVMPALWTRGYDATVVGEGASSNNNREEPTRTGTIMRACRANLPAFVLGLVVMETIQCVVRFAVARIFVAASSSWLSSSSSALPGRVGSAMVAAAVAAPRIRAQYLENGSRRLLWSQRRLWCATVAALSVVWMLAARFV
jgi:hypothetical protein